LWKQMPVYAACFLIITLSSIGLPGLNGFVGEFLILLGGFRFDVALGAIAASGVVLGAAYMLWMYQRVMFGEITNEKNATLKDMSPRELAVILPLVALAFVMGVYPKPFFDTMRTSVARTLDRIPDAALAANGHKSDIGRAAKAGATRTRPAVGASSARPAAAAKPVDPHAGHDHAGHDHGSHGGEGH
ncbi:MAG: proton-conducting transporter membrane subunit, partial [Candidatus Binatia bacterium]